eukprot:6075060-Ditylum_brightwellii.AAC.1
MLQKKGSTKKILLLLCYFATSTVVLEGGISCIATDSYLWHGWRCMASTEALKVALQLVLEQWSARKGRMP